MSELSTNTNTTEPTPAPAKELSIHDMLDLAKVYLREVIKFSWLIAGLAVLLGYYLYQRKLKEPIYYTASLSFMMSEDKGFQQGMLGSLLGVSMNMEGGGGGGLTLNKLEELLTTRKIIQLTLFQKAKIRTNADTELREDYLINHFLRMQGYGESSMFATDSARAFTRDENARLLTVHNRIVNNGLSKYTTPGGIFNMSFTSPSEEFAYEFLLALYNTLDAYYFEKSIEKQKLLHDAAVERVGKIKGEMQQAENDFIQYKNENNSPSSGQHHVTIKTQYLARELQVKMEAYFAAVRSEEAAKVALEQQTPLIQLIDAPVYPLSSTTPNGFMHLIIGVVVGAILGIALVVGRKLVADWWTKEKIRRTAAATDTKH